MLLSLCVRLTWCACLRTTVPVQQLQLNLHHIRADHTVGPNVSCLTALPRVSLLFEVSLC